MAQDKENKTEFEESDKTNIIPSETFKGRMQQAEKSPACLVCLVGPAGYVGRQWELKDSEIIIGRSVKSNVFINDKSVSRSHVRISINNFEVFICDLDSSNKTVVNETTLVPLKSYQLKQNDQIRTGNVVFKFLEPGSLESITTKETFDRSQIDALTEVFNKGALLLSGPELYKRSEMLSIPFSLVLFDIDYFKKINDTYGHAAGDYILKELATTIKDRLVRTNDFFARYGGEEFVLVLSGSPLKDALDVAERIRTTIEAHDFVFKGTKISVTISAGVYSKQKEILSWDQIFEKADQALYMSKNSGRNRVSTS